MVSPGKEESFSFIHNRRHLTRLFFFYFLSVVSVLFFFLSALPPASSICRSFPPPPYSSSFLFSIRPARVFFFCSPCVGHCVFPRSFLFLSRSRVLPLAFLVCPCAFFLSSFFSLSSVWVLRCAESAPSGGFLFAGFRCWRAGSRGGWQSRETVRLEVNGGIDVRGSTLLGCTYTRRRQSRGGSSLSRQKSCPHTSSRRRRRGRRRRSSSSISRC